jgi:hypothetical protein
MSENSKPVTKYVVLKITYNSYFVESPETWDWNTLIDSGADEYAEVMSIRDFPPSDEF